MSRTKKLQTAPHTLKKQATNFIVLTSQRSGSTWFMDSINSTNEIHALGELFIRFEKLPDKRIDLQSHSKFILEDLDSFPAYQSVSVEKHRTRPLSVIEYLDILYAHSGCIGFKLMYTQLLRYPEIWIYIIQKKIPIIHLIRRNLLNVVISIEVKKITKIAHINNKDLPVDIPQIELDPKRVIRQMKYLSGHIAMARWLLSSFRIHNQEIAYEDLFGDRNGFNAVWDFLSLYEIDPIPTSSYKKIIHKEISDIVQNYEEIRDNILSTEFAWMLN